MITFHQPEWIEEPGDISLHAEVIPSANDPAHGVLPCPFCGSPYVTVVNTHTPKFTVKCDSCTAEVGGRYVGNPPFKTRAVALRNYRKAFKLAIQAWNQRLTAPCREVITWENMGQPDEGELVIVQTNKHDVEPAYLESCEWFWASGGKVDGEVIYWTPMPEGIATRARMQDSMERSAA